MHNITGTMATVQGNNSRQALALQNYKHEVGGFSFSLIAKAGFLASPIEYKETTRMLKKLTHMKAL
jgi:hypothetical protein